jgi:hypothetical protein
MKRLIFVLFFFLTACGGGNKNDSDSIDNPQRSETATATSTLIADYFPIKTNTSYYYESPNYPEINQQAYITYSNGQRIQRRVASGDTSATEVLQYQEGELRLVFGEPNYYFFEDLTTVEQNLDVLLLKEPLVPGQTWQMDATATSEVTASGANVSTPMGNYTALEVSTSYTDGRSQREYYAPRVGLVKTVYSTSDGSEYEFSLASVTESAVLDVPADFYIHSTDGTYEREERVIQVSTNSDLLTVFREELKKPSETGYEWLPGEITVNSIELDRANDAVIIDISGRFNEEGGDMLRIQSIADTLGQFYGTAKAKVLANGEFYDLDEYIEITVEENQVGRT